MAGLGHPEIEKLICQKSVHKWTILQLSYNRFSYKTIILVHLSATVFGNFIFDHASLRTAPKSISDNFLYIRSVLPFRFIPFGFIFEHAIGSDAGAVIADFVWSRGLMTQIFVFADVDFGVTKYQTKKYASSAWFCT